MTDQVALTRMRLGTALAELAAELEIASETVLGFWREKAAARMLLGQAEDSSMRDAYDETIKTWRRRER